MKKLIDKLKKDNPCFYSDIHGEEHYLNVMNAGLRIVDNYNLNPMIIKYFAYLHDSCRHNEDYDPNHGPRAAAYITKIKKYIDLDSDELIDLQSACFYHTSAKPWDGETYSLIEQCCFAADRSDIGRVNLVLDPVYLFTEFGVENFASA